MCGVVWQLHDRVRENRGMLSRSKETEEEGESGRRKLAPRHDVTKRTDPWYVDAAEAVDCGLRKHREMDFSCANREGFTERCIRTSSTPVERGCRSGRIESEHASSKLKASRYLNNHLTRPRPRLLIIALELALYVSLINRLLDRACSLVSQLLVLEHCFTVSTAPHPVLARHLQKVSSSSVRLYVSG
jgi:hypothetical protein